MNLHEGHRERLRNRFVSEGGKNFAAHNLMELLLFYGIPRKDTNEIAHRLLERFGDIKGVLSATVEDLCLVKGVTKSAAVLIKLCNELCGRLYNGDLRDMKRFDSFDDIGEYLVHLFYGFTEEYVYLLLLDSEGNLLNTTQLCRGSVNSVTFDSRQIILQAYKYNACGIIIAHNHPGATVYPSTEDLLSTKSLASLLEVNGLELSEHYIVSDHLYLRVLDEAKKFREY